MSVPWTRAATALLVSLALSACSGGGSPGGSAPPSKQTTLAIKIAGSATQAKFKRLAGIRHTKYVSVATNGISIFVYPSGQKPNANPTAVAPVNATSPYCQVASDGSGDRVCSIPVTAPSGNDDFVVNGYDQVPANGVVQGNLLETGTANAAIVPGQQNQVNVTFEGEVASIAVAPVWQVSQNDGATHSYSFAVNAFDADGYQIIDVVPFANPLTVAIANDPNSTLSITPPGSGSDPRLYTLNYNGGMVNDAQITASASGVAQTTTMDFTPMITTPQSLTVSVGGTATYTAQLAVPSDQTPQSDQFFESTAPSPPNNNCSVSPAGPSNTIPWVNGNPVTFTVTGNTSGTCVIALIGPQTNTGFPAQTVSVKVQAAGK